TGKVQEVRKFGSLEVWRSEVRRSGGLHPGGQEVRMSGGQEVSTQVVWMSGGLEEVWRSRGLRPGGLEVSNQEVCSGDTGETGETGAVGGRQRPRRELSSLAVERSQVAPPPADSQLLGQQRGWNIKLMKLQVEDSGGVSTPPGRCRRSEN
ncbi:hypothetical protein NHX12_006567, partial [Muraenolepis orangiensis]